MGRGLHKNIRFGYGPSSLPVFLQVPGRVTNQQENLRYFANFQESCRKHPITGTLHTHSHQGDRHVSCHKQEKSASQTPVIPPTARSQDKTELLYESPHQ